MVEAIYLGQLQLSAATIEPVWRAADAMQMSELEQHCVKYLLNLAKSDHAGDALRVGTYQLAHDLNKLQLQQQIALHIAASCHLTSSSGITALHGILSSPPYDTDTHQLLQLLQQSRVEAWGPTGPHITSVEVIMQLQQQGVIAACDYLLDAVAWRELSALEIKTAARTRCQDCCHIEQRIVHWLSAESAGTNASPDQQRLKLEVGHQCSVHSREASSWKVTFFCLGPSLANSISINDQTLKPRSLHVLSDRGWLSKCLEDGMAADVANAAPGAAGGKEVVVGVNMTGVPMDPSQAASSSRSAAAATRQIAADWAADWARPS
eukprot:jgi/Chrzof1/11414/Cz05g35240.t1